MENRKEYKIGDTVYWIYGLEAHATPAICKGTVEMIKTIETSGGVIRKEIVYKHPSFRSAISPENIVYDSVEALLEAYKNNVV